MSLDLRELRDDGDGGSFAEETVRPMISTLP